MNETTLNLVVITSGVLGCFICLSLVTTSFYKSRANNYLSLSLFLLINLTFLGSWSDKENLILDFLGLIMLEYLVAVTLFIYFLIQIEHKYLKEKWFKWLYAPFICSFIIEIILHLDTVFHLYDSDFAVVVDYIKLSTVFSYNLFLIFWSRHLVTKSNTISKEKKRWLLRLNFFITSIIICWLLANIEVTFFESEYSANLLRILLSILSWWILYYGVFKLQVIVQKDEIHQYLSSKKESNAKSKRIINETTVSKIVTQLYTLMEEEQLFKDPFLSRYDLAIRLETNEGYLSQIINDETNKSVVQFVNEYRVKAAQNILHNPVFNKYSVEAIGMEVGFKSKSAFYKTFNSSLGMSPGAYRKLKKTS
ncbi:AraC family transcriptional regulator [Aquimarina sp. AD1]|uniref:helix-turn-helix domain-containing protein n=2 Tax=Aquimarina sp. (strain AD1) TaxID=1714848 RepID=UPI000E4870C4|nr:helix-turn-helix domain-containing protein [Aquimarina sp. AD1]AXT54466.1 AraC family transcriptional regulator [Aquimarina sp. AD1]RKN36766.1 helix-turn-helix domain-containing protein [Aquimarina sp. AD1]